MDNKGKTIQPNYYNTWEYVREERERIKTENYDIPNSLEAAWKRVTSNYKDYIRRNEDETVAATPLGAFLYYIEVGLYPPPELLLAIATCFRLYEDAEGAFELDEVLFGSRKKKGVGNYSAQLSRNRLYELFSITKYFERRKKEVNPDRQSKSTTALAEEFIHQNSANGVDAESFLRGYRRWKKRQDISDK
uniref:hypothetical protein n=1 Tax=Marinobacterium profundum TaxID=1714300 RepID=UPI000A4199A0|nr:hypothetical protein [Marinobacterium profundum]